MMKPIPLSPLDCERALRLAGDVRIAELELAAVVARGQARLEKARAAHAEHVKTLAKRYRFKAEDLHFRIDEATQTLRPCVERSTTP